MTLDAVFDAVTRALAEEIPSAVELRHELHARPEVSGSETWTAARVAAALDEPDAATVAGTGRLIRLGPTTGPAIAVRAELDALPVRERHDARVGRDGAERP